MSHWARRIGTGSRRTIGSAGVEQQPQWQHLRTRMIEVGKALRFHFDVGALVLTIAFVLLSFLTRFGLDQIAPDISPFTTFYPAVVLSGFLWDLSPALLALLCSTAVAWWAFLPPRWTFFITPDWESLIALLIFPVTGGLIVWITGAYHGTQRKLRAEQESRELLNRECICRKCDQRAITRAA